MLIWVGQGDKDVPLDAATADIQIPPTDTMANFQGSAMVQNGIDTMGQSQDPGVTPRKTSPSLAPHSRPSASQDNINVDEILGMLTRDASPSHGDRSSSRAHQMQQMQDIKQSIASLEERSEDFVREQEFTAFRNDYAAFKDEVWRVISAMAASIAEINRRT